MRSVRWCLAIFAMLAIGTSALIAVTTTVSSWGGSTSTMGQAVAVVQLGAALGEIAIMVLGAMAIGGEYRSGMIKVSLMSVPWRGRMLAAKMTVFAAATLVTTLVVVGISFAVQLAAGEVLGSVTDPGVLRSLLGLCAYLTVLVVLTMAVGAMIRHTAGVIFATLGLFYVLPVLLSLVPGTEKLVEVMPLMAGMRITDMAESAPWGWFALYCAWAAGMFGLAVLGMRRRDA
ncbi:ABC-type transport system involved in multi-copper enzyme maturation permease subunit [Nonomuraea africana]|uniref:ABC-type transport system involved in multi-copper enzyme maturation permease subunit n=1 Tax=Nonomuraea africana TaxID=46171 RepID=A0ABR9K9D4_9ACTN|nr:ABC-type transport system involved in multi-copper enzyme maturation permease subunit [Nonomuraea africana]